MHVIQSDAWPHPNAVLLAKLAYSLFPDISLALRKRLSSHALTTNSTSYTCHSISFPSLQHWELLQPRAPWSLTTKCNKYIDLLNSSWRVDPASLPVYILCGNSDRFTPHFCPGEVGLKHATIGAQSLQSPVRSLEISNIVSLMATVYRHIGFTVNSQTPEWEATGLLVVSMHSLTLHMYRPRISLTYGYDADSSEHYCKVLAIISLIKGLFQ